MGERMDLICEIVRWVSDEPQPGWVAARFTDAAGRSWELLDKPAVFSSEPIDSHSAYPQAGVVRCQVPSRRDSSRGTPVARVRAIDAPRTEGDVEEFEVEESQLTSPIST
jgi:hypothetical protein